MIIGIESSCDESAVALFNPKLGIEFEEVASQIDLHSEYGGVVPELASREHTKNFIPLLQHLKSFGIDKASQIAVTHEPGLPGCVNIGIAVANALSLTLKLPVIKINHLYGHLLSPFLPLHQSDPGNFFKNFKNLLPHIGLLVSGGNTILFKVSQDLKITTLAETVDDAAGEAFDKGAKLLGLPYPGGALIEKLALKGDKNKFHFPRAFADSDTMKFSFSGLKTSLRYFLEKNHTANIADICASYQEAIIDALIMKLSYGLDEHTDIKSIGVSGGVSNNNELRNKISNLADRYNLSAIFPLRHHTGDNAAMIAFAAFVQQF